MKKIRSGLILLFLFPFYTMAQDVIVLKNGDEIKSKVSEIGISEIKYKKFDNLNGPVISILKSDVFMIKYENGTKDVFNSSTATQPVKASAAITSNKKYSGLVYAGLSIPVGTFASTTDNDGGAARLGGTLGHEGTISLNNPNVYLLYNINYTLNPYKISYQDPYYSIEFKGTYNLVYTMFGFKFQSNPSPSRFYGLFAGGLNIGFLTGDLKDAGYNSGTGFVLAAGTGVSVNGHFNVGLRYLYSRPKYSFTNNYYGVGSIDVEQKTSVLQFIIGAEF